MRTVPAAAPVGPPSRQSGAAAQHTTASLTADLAALGVESGEVLWVQAGLRSVGRVAGGAATVVRALLEALGGTGPGTLVTYTATPENSDTSRLAARLTEGLTPEGLAAHRAAMPAFDPRTTPASPTMGRLAEQIRRTPGAVRSSHPQTSFAAVGRHARRITGTHELDCHLGESSPLGRLYELGARVLLVDVPLSRLTAFHLADLRAADLPTRPYGCVVRDGTGQRRWQHFQAPDLDDRHFGELAGALLGEGRGIRSGRFGDADCLLVPVVEAVDVAGRVLRGRAGPAPAAAAPRD